MSIGIYRAGSSYQNAFDTRSAPNYTPDIGAAPKTGNAASPSKAYNDLRIRMEKRMGLIECETCSSRKYQDGSNDSSVSFKSPGHISPEASAGVISAHEQEHVSNEVARAKAEGRKVVSQSVTLQSSACPECGKVYVSGGKTTTVTKADSREKNDFYSNKYRDFMAGHFGKILDIKL